MISAHGRRFVTDSTVTEVYTPEFCILDSVYSTRRSVEGKVANTMETGSRNYVTIAKGCDYCPLLAIRQFCDISLAYGRVKSDYVYNESFSTSRLLILYAALVTVLFLPHCPPLPYRAD